MTKKLIPALLALSAFTAEADVSIDSVVARQLWPWSTKVRVEYVLSGVESPVDITVKAYNGSKELELPHLAVSGDRYGITANGPGSFEIDPVAAFGTEPAALTDFRVELSVSPSADNLDEALYKIFEISSGKCTNVTRKALLNGKWGAIETDYSKIGEGFTTGEPDVLIWTGVTNNPAYKTTHLVMRKIHASGKTWLAGDPEGTLKGNAALQTPCYVRLTYDFYIGVFEMTEAQHARCTSAASANVSTLPQGAMALYHCYAHTGTDYASYFSQYGSEKICFPTNSYLRDVGGNTPVATLWNRTRSAGQLYEFTLPLRAEWEFACHGGNDGVLYSGEEQNQANVDKLAWFYDNSGGVSHEVGSKAPNVYGLYDMLGNVIERVCTVGHYSAEGVTGTGTQSDPYENPICRRDTTSTSNPSLMGGGSFESTDGYWQDCRPEPAIGWVGWQNTHSRSGYRVVIPATANGRWADQ